MIIDYIIIPLLGYISIKSHGKPRRMLNPIYNL
jgi:hypothetical protein